MSMIIMSLAISVGLSVLLLCCVQCCPRFWNKAVIYLSAIVILGLAICLWIYPSDHSSKVPLAIALVVLFFCIILSLCLHKSEFEFQDIFMDAATRMLKDDNCCVFFYIPLFMLFTAAFGIILIFEFKSFWGGGELTFDKEKSIFWEF